ncbi:CaiB/BaiF CoA-transferase family protein [Bradyrhizobium sp. Leo121]|uniref:CaiB/BaiF CoA transferase family protein n=1 Tax=Bradyrhizobium sp. Leo121 TaxID=1571195 RepID=UPI001029F4E2|nr:CaiB/BaiF CoA-transferase family protein [Bradyrhizobium sp. Leo121]RZN30747.1 carnitine dehydratase [Bradyrhizobium sp. Leo121]
MSGPLSSLTVVELAGIGPGPFACMMLADAGARVIRVDRPPVRGSAADGLFRNDGFVDRGRQSLALDLKQPAGVQAALRLIERADVLIEGFRPGVTERMGLGPEVCLARNPRLVYGRMTGWGQHGPYANMAGHDINYIGLSGALHAMGSDDRPPPPPLNLVGDYGGGGMLLAFGVVAAIVAATATGRGQVIDAAMADGAALLMAPIYGMAAKGYWCDQRGANFLDGAAHFYGTYECADGKFVAVGAIEPQFYRSLLDICGIGDPAFKDQWRAEAWPALRDKLAAVFRSKTRAEWVARFEGTDACVTPVLSMNEAPLHPHYVARATFAMTEAGSQPAPGPRFESTKGGLPAPAPATGRDTRVILREVGYETGAIEDLLRNGAAYQPTDGT